VLTTITKSFVSLYGTKLTDWLWGKLGSVPAFLPCEHWVLLFPHVPDLSRIWISKASDLHRHVCLWLLHVFRLTVGPGWSLRIIHRSPILLQRCEGWAESILNFHTVLSLMPCGWSTVCQSFVSCLWLFMSSCSMPVSEKKLPPPRIECLPGHLVLGQAVPQDKLS
jgi:hypothetical protein